MKKEMRWKTGVLWFAASLLPCIAVGLAVTNRLGATGTAIVPRDQALDSDAKLRALAAQQAPEGMPPSAEKTPDRNRRARKLYNVWMQRGDRDVAAEVVAFLDDDDATVRQSAARALGRLESGAVEQALSGALQRARQKNREDDRRISSTTLELAQGRAHSRGLKGQAKVEALTQSVGLSFDEVVRLSPQIKSSAAAGGEVQPPGEVILDETVDLLYRMAKHGEKVRSLSERLTLNPAQRVKIAGGSLPQEREIALILDYLCGTVYNIGDYKLIDHLGHLGPHAYDALVGRLQELRPQTYAVRRAKTNLLRAAAQMRNEDALPLIKTFEDDADLSVRREAKQLRRLIKWQIVAPPLP